MKIDLDPDMMDKLVVQALDCAIDSLEEGIFEQGLPMYGPLENRQYYSLIEARNYFSVEHREVIENAPEFARSREVHKKRRK